MLMRTLKGKQELSNTSFDQVISLIERNTVSNLAVAA